MIYIPSYLPTGNVQKSKEVSKALWALLKPENQPDDVTIYYCDWVVHPDRDEAWIYLDLNAPVPIHAYARTDLIQTYLEMFVTFNLIPAARVPWVLSQVELYKGTVTAIGNFLHEEALALQRTEQQMKDAGFFPAPNMETDPGIE